MLRLRGLPLITPVLNFTSKSFEKWFAETWHTLSVTTYHPIGWGVSRIRSKLRRTRRAHPVSVHVEKSSPILLVHGVLHNSSAFYRMEKVLSAEGFSQVRTLELYTVMRSLESLAARLKEEVHAWSKEQYVPRKVRIVAHSLGGVVTRIALLDPFFAEQVEKVVFLGVPHQGYSYPFPLPRSLHDLHRNEKLRKRLREEPLPGGIRYWNIRGKLDLVTPGHITFLPHVPNLVFDGVGHAGLLSNPKVVQSVVEILETPHYDLSFNEFSEQPERQQFNEPLSGQPTPS